MTNLSVESISDLGLGAVILDTNAFVEGYSHPAEFSDILSCFAKAEVPVTAIEAIRLEFLSKNKSAEELQKKVAFYKETLTYPELPTRTFELQFQEYSLLHAFGVQAQGFKAVDFMIAAALKKYGPGVALLTNDHHDFTPQLFDLDILFPLMPSSGCVIPFGLYRFSERKYASLIR